MDSIVAGTSKQALVKIYNVGNGILHIEDYKCSCECTIVETSKNSIINPNDSINIKINITGYRDDIGKWKSVLCTFKTNSDSIFLKTNLVYFTTDPNNVYK